MGALADQDHRIIKTTELLMVKKFNQPKLSARYVMRAFDPAPDPCELGTIVIRIFQEGGGQQPPARSEERPLTECPQAPGTML